MFFFVTQAAHFSLWETNPRICFIWSSFMLSIVFVKNLLSFLSHMMFYTWYVLFDRAIGLMSRVFANDPGDRGSIPGRVISKTQKVVWFGYVFGFYGISTFVGYSMPNPFLCK